MLWYSDPVEMYHVPANSIQDLRNHGDSYHDSRHDYDALGDDIESFIEKYKLKDTTLIGHSMGAKASMVVALRSPHLVANLIPVDNAPVDAALKSDFGQYVKGMKKVEEAKVKKQSEADAIFKEYEEVSTPGLVSLSVLLISNSHYLSANSSYLI
jgi:pimeloyl-ACP methyl ester carboxylesterase